jgi:hypothetical protein
MSNNSTALKNQPDSEFPDLPDFLRRAGAGEVVPVDDVEPVLAEHANEIRRLGKRVIENVIEIGRRLVDAKSRIAHGGWLLWLDREFGWTEQTALNFVHVYELTQSPSKNFLDLNIPVSGLYLLAAPSTPDEVRNEILSRAGKGEALSVGKVKDIIAGHKKKSGTPSSAVTNAPIEENQEKEKEKELRPLRESRRRLSCSARWANAATRAEKALSELRDMQGALEQWRDNLPENFQGSAVAEKLDAVCDLEIHGALEIVQEAAGLDLPRGFRVD